MNSATDRIKQLDDAHEASLQALQSKFETEIEAVLVSEGMDAFVLWAKAFPKRHLRFVSGMGSSVFACPSLDNSSLLQLDDYFERRGLLSTNRYSYRKNAAAMVQPLIDFHNLFWSSELYQYPCISDIIYNPVTRTVECGQVIIQLDKGTE